MSEVASVEGLDSLETAGITTLLVDADGTLFPSEEPAYAASAGVTNKFLASLGETRVYAPHELQALTNGKNFRAASLEFARSYGAVLSQDEMDTWVTEEKDVVTAHLREVLRPSEGVGPTLEALAERFRLAAVTSSALTRLDACLGVTELSAHFHDVVRFSAEDSLPQPSSKPDPAVYRLALETLGIRSDEALAIEDSVNGTLSAVAAGIRTIGTVQFLPAHERTEAAAKLIEAGAEIVIDDFSDLRALLEPSAVR